MIREMKREKGPEFPDLFGKAVVNGQNSDM
jgi:hypothetical protein